LIVISSFGGSFGCFQGGLGAGEFCLDGRHHFGQGGNFIFQAVDFLVRLL